MDNEAWQPDASVECLRQRAKLLAKIRRFFSERYVMEVETPLLSRATVTDVQLHSLQTKVAGNTYYLQTSPEYAMKRLLAAESGAIYQLCKAFRDDEQGQWHNPEFTLLEWYHPGFDHHDLMIEVDQFLKFILTCGPAELISYQQVFSNILKINPFAITDDDLIDLAKQHGLADVVGVANIERDLALQWLMSEVIEKNIGEKTPCFVYDFPASQAALAIIRQDTVPVAERFEVYYHGIELANGFHELADAKEQRQRFERDLEKRKHCGATAVPIDENLLSALESGLPNCAGVALGVDRLMMLAMNKTHLSQVISFTINNA